MNDAPTRVAAWTLRAGRAEDVPAVVAINQANLPHVSPLTHEAFERLVALGARVLVAEGHGRVVAFAVVMREDVDYASVNFRWFLARYPRFLYVDRIAVDEGSRREGIASGLYGEVDTLAREAGVPCVTCEVNTRPPNPESLAFHLRHGFAEVGTQETEGGQKTVSLLLKDLVRK